jgi:hypothetical protein
MKHPRNIIRVDNESHRTHGWRVTLKRRGEIIGKTFSDGVHGGKRKALKAAIEHLKALHSQNSTLEYQLWFRTRLRKDNTSGIPGVGRYEAPNHPYTGRRVTFWLASWTNEQGVKRQRKFYVSRYGEHQAKLLAIAEREYQLLHACAVKVSKHRGFDTRQMELDFGEEATDVDPRNDRR